MGERQWENDTSWSPNSISTTPGQGLPAWTFIHHGADGAWRAPEAKHEDDVPQPRHFAAIKFNTVYSYTGPNDIDCTQLHALLMHDVADWLEPQGIPWQWRNEYTDEIHDQYEGFEAFIGHGIDAMQWLNTVVIPAIQANTGETPDPS